VSAALIRLRAGLAYQGISLGVIALLAATALAVGDHLTRAPIAAAAARDLQASLTQVLPEGFADNDLLADVREVADAGGTRRVYRARRDGRVVGAVFQDAARGYAGEIVVLIGVDTAGRLLGVRVLRHSETPGLGDKIEAAKSRWIHAFAGRSLDDPGAAGWAVRKDGGMFDQFAGATITPRAVVRAVHAGLAFHAAHRAEINDVEDAK